jgi:transforming growth factor-beta-induced protein
MKNKKNYIKIFPVLGITILFLISACDKKEPDLGQNLVDVLSADSDLSTMVAAIKYGNLGPILEYYSAFTVFAPTNAAFEEYFGNLGVSSVEDLSTETVDSILLYHLLPGAIEGSSFSNGFVSTLSAGPDSRAMVMLMSGYNSTLNKDANITGFNIMASNGIIHVIDKVLTLPTIYNIVNMGGDYRRFIEAMSKAEMDSILVAKGPYTIFAPTDDAFDDLFIEQGISGIDEMSKEQLVPILKFHIAQGNYSSNNLIYATIVTLNGNLDADLSSSFVVNGNANVLDFNLQGKNGVIHSINKVLIPGK